MRLVDADHWMKSVKAYLQVDFRLRIFPIPMGEKFLANSEAYPPGKIGCKGFDVHKWALETPPVIKELEFNTGWHLSNIGASCQDMIVVDLDVKEKIDPETGEMRKQEGFSTWKRWTAGKADWKTWISHTPSGGIHIFFKLTPEQKKRWANQLRPKVALEHKWSGVDIRTGRSHVVLPESSGSYTVIEDGKEVLKWGNYQWHETQSPWKGTKMREAPEWLLQKICMGSEKDQHLKKIQRKALRGRKGKGPIPLTEPEEMYGLVEGGRSDGLYAYAKELVWQTSTHIHAEEIDSQKASAIVWERLNKLNQYGTGGNPVSKHELSGIYKSAMKRSKKLWALVPKAELTTVLEVFPGAEVTDIKDLRQ